MKPLLTKGVAVLTLLGMLVPAALFAHPEPIKVPVLYNQTVSITSVTVDDDNNYFGPADLFFDYIVDALDPPHEQQSGITDTFKVSSGTTKSFDPPLEIYSHDTCHCDEKFDIDIVAFDHAPVKTILGTLLEKGLDWLTSYLTGGTVGLVISALGDLLELLIDALMQSGLSEEEAAYQAYVQLINESDMLGGMREEVETDCEPADVTYKSDLALEEFPAGWLTYRIVKTAVGVCAMEEPEIGTAADPEGIIEEPVDVPTVPDPKEEIETSAEKEVVQPQPEADEPSEEIPEPKPEIFSEPKPETSEEDFGSDEERAEVQQSADCFAAVNQAISKATDISSPNIYHSSEHLIGWALESLSCEDGKNTVASYASAIQKTIPSVNADCPSLSYKGASFHEGTDTCSADFYFSY